ncbi:class I SAM-dependent DNA methyltransferase [Candidatus Raskinella chloraquaticus]|uniref:Methyltransferase type 12 domain-containing protein n=2 Tax=Candidatus Raskinella chloraquaticus TaxID=1951219 RepID=A0A1W9I2M4_9HYPH|nr:MAG: hypothetical protein A4S15_00395 [Proteobacteria bacterium SG_bin8]
MNPVYPPNSSSGNLLADRRYDYALALMARGDDQGAGDLLHQALDLVPGWAAAHVALGEILAKRGDIEQACAALRAALVSDPVDHLGAGARLAVLRGETPDHLPPAHVQALFDGYAARFEDSLVGALNYRAPSLLVEAVEAVLPGHHFAAMLDLGCGTGLGARAFADRAAAIDGIDLSPGMLRRARDSGLYRQLIAGDLTALLQTPAASSLQPGYDLVIAADVFVYLGELYPTLQAIFDRLAAGGVLAFTVQSHAGDGVVLGADYRFAHASTYLAQLAHHLGFTVRAASPAVTRQDRGIDVPGELCVWAKS